MDFSRLAAGNVVYHVLYLGRGLIAARVLGPELMGVWAAGYVLNTYLTNSHLGSLSAMRREMTIARGKADAGAFEAVRRAGFTLAVSSALIAASCVFLWVGAFGRDLTPTYRWVVLLISVLAVMQQVGLFYSFCLYAREDFTAVGRVNTVVAVSLIATAPLIWTHGLVGYAVGALFSQALGLYLLGRAAGTPGLSRDWAEMKRLLREGLPFFGSILIFTVQNSIDRLVVLAYYGERYLGLYALALQALALANVFVESLSQVSYSKMGIHFGVSDSPELLYGRYRRIPLVLAWAVVPLLAGASIAAEPIVNLILPKYFEAVPALRAICIQAFFMTLTVIPAGFLLTIRRNGVYLVIQAFAAALTWLACIASARLDMGLAGVAIATACATAVYALCLGIASVRLAKHRFAEFLRDMGRVGLPLIIGVTIVIAVLRALSEPSLATIGTAATALVASGAIAFSVLRRTGFFGLMSVPLQTPIAAVTHEI
jgi:O-antigen/teichoic acid export membrane protein